MSCSTSGNQSHLVRSGRTSSRVLAQPGGQSSLSFGTWAASPPSKAMTEPTPTVQDQPDVATSEKVEAPKLEENANDKDEVIAKENEEEVNDEKEQDSTENVESKPDKSMTTESDTPNKENDNNTQAVPVEAPKSNMIPANQGIRPSSRVLAPPGGHCSIKLG